MAKQIDVDKLIEILKENSEESDAKKSNGNNIKNGMVNISDKDDGTNVSYKRDTFDQKIYDDIKELKKNTDSLIKNSLEITPQIGKMVKTIEDLKMELLKSIEFANNMNNEKIENINNEIDMIKKEMPEGFFNWIMKRGPVAKNIEYLFKNFLYLLLIIYVLISGMPTVSKFLGF